MAAHSVIEDLDALARVSTGFERALGFVEPRLLRSPTPCANWDVSDLLDHVTGGNRYTVAIFAGATSSAALEAARAAFGPDHDPAESARSSLGPQREAFETEGALMGSVDHVAGTLTGREALRLRIHDMNIHTWDLNQAVHPQAGLDPALARWAMAELAEADSLTARHIAIHTDRPPTSAYALLQTFGRRRASLG